MLENLADSARISQHDGRTRPKQYPYPVTNRFLERASKTMHIDTVERRSFPYLDGYRAIAALAVVTTHVAYFCGVVVVTSWGHAMARLDFGVTIFFLLSGFLLFRPWSAAALADSRWPSTRTYFRRRLWRILPAYLAVVAVVLLVMPGIEVRPKQWITHLTLTQIYVPKALVNGLTQSWSLATEISFYLVLPLIAWFIGRRYRGDVNASTRRQLWVLAACAVIAFAWLLLRTLTPMKSLGIVNMWLPAFMDWFAVGMLFALVHNRLKQPDPPRWMQRLNRLADDPAVCLLLAGGLFLLATTPLAGPYTFGEGNLSQAFARHYLYLAAGAAFLLPGVLGTDGVGTWRKMMASPLMVYLGTISYGIFLWHLFVLETTTHLLGIDRFTGWFWLVWPMTVVITIGIAHLSYVFIERPAIRYSHSSSHLNLPWRSRGKPQSQPEQPQPRNPAPPPQQTPA